MNTTNKFNNYIGLILMTSFAYTLLLTGCAKKTAIDENKTNQSLSAGTGVSQLAAAIHTETNVFATNEGNYHSFRCPGIAYAVNPSTGAMVYVAVAEGRNVTSKDYGGNTNIVCKRSLDGGQTWVSMQNIASNGAGTYGNPTILYDPAGGTLGKGRLWVACTYAEDTITDFTQIGVGGQPVYLYYHDDLANPNVAWQRLTSVTQAQIVPNGTTTDQTGPGIGIKLSRGNHIGRLVFPSRRRNIISDNGGATWTYESLAGADTGEPTVVELDNGFIMRNDRPKGNVWDTSPYRSVRKPDVNGVLLPAVQETQLPDPKCEGSILRYSFPNGATPGTIVFCNSASTNGNGTDGRYFVKVRTSVNNGNNWSAGRYLYSPNVSGKGGYTSMIRLDNYTIGLLVENESSPGGSYTADKFSIKFHKINLDWINGL